MDVISMKKIMSTAKTEYLKWIYDSRMIIIPILIIFLYTFAIEPLLVNAQMMEKPLNLFEPFIAVANSGVILMIIPLTFMTLISDFPKIDTNTVFYICRTGRINWLLGQIIKLVMMAFSFLGVVFIGTVIPMIGKGFIGNNWSNVTLYFKNTFPEQSGNFGTQLIPENLYNQLSIADAAVQSYLLVFAYLMIIGLLLLFFSLIKKKTVGFVLTGAMIILGTGLCSLNSQLMWIMPMANSIVWIHFTKYFREPVKTIGYSITYLCVFILVLLVLCLISIDRFNYDNVSEIAS